MYIPISLIIILLIIYVITSNGSSISDDSHHKNNADTNDNAGQHTQDGADNENHTDAAEAGATRKESKNKKGKVSAEPEE